MERPDPSGAVMPLMCTWENRIPEEEGKTTRGLCAPCGGPRVLLGDGPTPGWVLVLSSPRVTLEVASLFTHQTLTHHHLLGVVWVLGSQQGQSQFPHLRGGTIKLRWACSRKAPPGLCWRRGQDEQDRMGVAVFQWQEWG